MNGAAIEIRLGDVWEQAIAYVRREGALVMPVAFAFFGLPTLLGLFTVPSMDMLQKGVGLGALACSAAVSCLGTLFGGLAVAALVLRPGGSVADALASAARRLATGLLAAVLIGAGMVLLAFVLLLVGTVFVAATHGGNVPSATDPALIAVVMVAGIAVLFVLVRVATLAPTIVDRPIGASEAIIAALRQTRPVFWRLLLLTILYNVAVQVAVRALELGGGAIAKIVALATGSGALLDALVMIASAALAAAASGFWAVLIALLYRALTPRDASAALE